MTAAALRRMLPLGTGSILMGAGRSAAGYLLECAGIRVLVDCGPGTLLRLSEAGVDRASIDYVLLSHFHPDHHADLIGLLFLRTNPHLASTRHRLTICAPPGFRAIYEAWSSVYGKWIEHPAGDVAEVEPGTFELGPLRVQAWPAEHTMPAYCYRFELADGTSLAYSGDTDECDGLVAACDGVDFCWIECSFPDADGSPGHLTPGRIRRVLEAARPRVAGLTHFYPPMEPVLTEAGWGEIWNGLETEVIVLRDLEEVVF